MTSSLARQLAGIGSLDAERLQAKTSKSRASFLFPARQAASLNNGDIHSLGYNGFLALLANDARLERFETPIFGEKAKLTDRTLLTKDENEKLDRTLAAFMRMLADKFLLKSTGKVLEWLIRRFRINEFNVEDVLSMILPYHETPQFAQMLQTLKLEKGRFTSFQAVKTSLQPLPRHHLITAMSKSHDLFLFVASMLKAYVQEGCVFSAMIAFWTGALVGHVDRRKAIDESEMSVLLPILVDGVKSPNKDLQLGNFIILTRLAGKVQLSTEALALLVSSVLSRRNLESDPETLEAILTTAIVLCESQSEALRELPRKTVITFMKSPQAVEILSKLSKSYSAAHLLNPFLTTASAVAGEDGTVADALYGMLAPLDCSQQLTASGLRALVTYSLRMEITPPAVLKVINAVYQRAEDSVRATCAEIVVPEQSQSAKTLLASIAGFGLLQIGSTDASDVALSLSSAEGNARAVALAKVLDAAAAEQSEALSPTLEALILERLADLASSVASTLFSEKSLSVVGRLASSSPRRVFTASLSTLSSGEVPKQTILAHFQYLVGPFLAAVPKVDEQKWRTEVFRKVVWPKLLSTKADKGSWMGIWGILEATESDWPLLAGCGGLKRGKDKDVCLAFNDALASRVADNLVKFGDKGTFKATLCEIFSQNSDETGSSKLLSGLVILRLLEKGDLYVARFLTRMSLTLPMIPAESLPSIETKVAIFTRPTSAKTLSRLASEAQAQAALCLRAPQGSRWCWLAAHQDLSSDVIHFREVAVKIYTAAHLSTTPSQTSARILQSLLADAVVEDILAFLASIFVSPDGPVNVRLAALNDAIAYLDALKKAQQAVSPNDYQMVLASLLVSLGSETKAIRQAAFGLLAKISAAAKQSPEDQRIYGLDQFYGAESAKVHYLSMSHLIAYVTLLQSSEAEVLLDHTRLANLHASRLQEESSGKRKHSLLLGVLHFVASHSNVLPNPTSRAALLSIVDNVNDTVKLQLLAPQLRQAVGTQGNKTSADLSGASVAAYSYSLARAFAAVPKSGLDEQGLLILRFIIESTSASALATSLRANIGDLLRQTLFSRLYEAQKVTVLEWLMSASAGAASPDPATWREAVSGLSHDTETITTYLVKMHASLSSEPTQNHKKSRSENHSGQTSRLTELAVLLESVDFARVEARPELLAVMLDMITVVVELNLSSRVDVTFYGLLLLRAISAVVSGLVQASAKVDDGIRIGPLLEIIRVSSSPQLANQALSVIADLAALVPEQVVQSVMPIFTFMGTNILQRDDAYSTRIVDKTLDNIVPALVKARRKRVLTRDQLVNDLNDFLRVMVDASSHVPRHRRNRLFTRFVEVLGPRDFLGPVCSLLVDKVAVKLIKTRDTSLLSLPLAVMGQFSANIQLLAFHYLVAITEAQALALNTEGSDGSAASRASTPINLGESPALPVQTSRKTILATLAYVEQCLIQKSLLTKLDQSRTSGSQDLDTDIQDLLKALFNFFAMKPQILNEVDIVHFQTSVKAIIQAAGRLLSSVQFAEVVEFAMEADNPKLVDEAFVLLQARLRSARPARRPDLSSAVRNALSKLSALVASSDVKLEKLRAIQNLRLIAASAVEQEYPTLLDVVTETIKRAGQETSKSMLLQEVIFISETIPRLGARIISQTSSIASLSMAVVRTFVDTARESIVKNIVAAAIYTLTALFRTVPTFVMGELRQVLNTAVSRSVQNHIYSEPKGRVETALSELLSTVTKEASSSILFENLVQLWSDCDKSDPVIIQAIVRILLLGLRRCDKDSIKEVYKTVFDLLLSVFRLRSTALSQSVQFPEIERDSIKAFVQMVTKMSEATFLPIFQRFFDWAAIEDVSDIYTQLARKTVLFKVVEQMVTQFQSFAMPYYAYTIDQTVEVLNDGEIPVDLGISVLACLDKALKHEAFWTAARLKKLVEPVVSHLVSPNMTSTSYSSQYFATLQSLAPVIESQETALHDLVRGYLKCVRSDDEAQQRLAVRALQSMWDAGISTSLSAYTPESMPFLVEALETGGEVAAATKHLLARMNESVEAEEEQESDDDDDDATESEEDE